MGSSVNYNKFNKYFSRNKIENLIDKYLNKNPDREIGTYVDLGANHAIKNSNTFYYYVRGWRGILVEPYPRHVKTLEKIRPRDIIIPKAIMDYNGIVEMNYNVVEKLNLEKHFKHKKKSNLYSVDCITIDSLIKEYPNFSKPDFLSIDIEGSEKKALSKCDFTKFKPKLICIEYKTKKYNFRKDWEFFLLPYYELKDTITYDAIYLRKEKK